MYWENGAQIIPPEDTGIADAIDSVGSIAELSLGDLATARAAGDLVDIDDALIGLYLDVVEGLVMHPGLLAKTPLTVAYTPMHGVGARFVKMALERVGVANVHIEPLQEEPDGDFPTVAFVDNGHYVPHFNFNYGWGIVTHNSYIHC